MAEIFVGYPSLQEAGAVVLISIKDALLTNNVGGDKFVQAGISLDDAVVLKEKLTAFINRHNP